MLTRASSGMSLNQRFSDLKKDNDGSCKRCGEMGQYSDAEYETFLKVLCRSVLSYTCEKEGGLISRHQIFIVAKFCFRYE